MTNARILVVDDENDIRELVREILTEEGYTVDTAGTAAELTSIVDAAIEALTRSRSEEGKRLAEFLLDAPVDDEHAVTIPIRFQGKPGALLVRVYMDDIDSPDLHFETDSKPLRNAIDAEMADFSKARAR